MIDTLTTEIEGSGRSAGSLSWPGKKVTKEAGSGEALTVKSIGTADCVFPLYPDFKPPSPENPSRPLRVS